MKNVYLVGRSGTHANEKFLLEGELIIGRDPQMCQLVYPQTEKKISGVHCKIQKIGDRVCLIDMSSTNGTYFQDGTKLQPDMPRTMESGQGFYLGSRENFFDLVIEEQVEKGRKGKWLKQQSYGEGKAGEMIPVSASAPLIREKSSAASAVLAVLLVVIIAIAGVLGFNYYQMSRDAAMYKQEAEKNAQEAEKNAQEAEKYAQEADKSAIEKGIDAFMEGDSLWDSVTNLFQ